MEAFLRGLLQDLERRCALLLDQLRGLAVDPDAQQHALAAYQALETLRREAARLLADPALGEPALLPNHLRFLQRWQRDASLVESYLLPFVERYAPPDRRLTRLCRRLTQQIGWPLDPPLVCGFSSSYYWTVGVFGLVCVPTGEGLTLLGLPDLCHELGHILLVRFEPQLLGSFVQELLAYVQLEQRQVAAGQRPRRYAALYNSLLAQWRDKWLLEFVSDMVGTYIVGPAYGWQHVRLCATTGQAAYSPTLGEVSDHPANEARLRGVLATLDELGAAASGAPVGAMWARYVGTTGEQKPADYDVCYPQTLIVSLAHCVVEGCRVLGLRRFAAAPAPSAAGAPAASGMVRTDIAWLLGDAWRRFLDDPGAYEQWERTQLDSLWEESGLGSR